jgi:hypothetical protein
MCPIELSSSSDLRETRQVGNMKIILIMVLLKIIASGETFIYFKKFTITSWDRWELRDSLELQGAINKTIYEYCTCLFQCCPFVKVESQMAFMVFYSF